MGEKLSTANIFCVDCGSRLITQEENESYSKIKSRDIKYFEQEDLTDEITVFESPQKFRKKQRLSDLQTKKKEFCTADDLISCTSRKTSNCEDQTTKKLQVSRLKNIKSESAKLIDENPFYECSGLGLNLSFSSNRFKTFSKHYSPYSFNLVESVRKNSESTNPDDYENAHNDEKVFKNSTHS